MLATVTPGIGSGRRTERGVALITVMMIMLLMSALMIGFATIVIERPALPRHRQGPHARVLRRDVGPREADGGPRQPVLDERVADTAQISALSTLQPTIPSVTFTAPSGKTAYGATQVACDSAGSMSCNGQVTSGPYQGLIALKKMYALDAWAKTSAGGEAHLHRKLETVAIPVFQFGTFSDVDLSLFAGANFTFGGRIHTNANLFLTAQSNGTTTLTDKMTAVSDVIRARMQNNQAIAAAGFNGTLKAATAPGAYRDLLINEGSLTDGVGSAVNTNWPTISLSNYNGYIRNGGCPPGVGCSNPPRGTGAKPLNLPLITVGGSNPDLARRPPVQEDINKPVLYGERLWGKVSLRILLSDTPQDITGLPSVTATAPVRLGDEAAAIPIGTTNDWNPTPAVAPVGGFVPGAWAARLRATAWRSLASAQRFLAPAR